MTQSLRKVFLSYASEDRERVLRLYENLRAAGFEPWIDVRDIPKGADWQKAIDDAIRSCSVFVACVSTAFVAKTGVLQKEIELALDERKGRKALLIPVRLDATPWPDSLRQIQWIDLKDDERWRDVAAAIREEEQRLTRRRWLTVAGVAVPALGAGAVWWWKMREAEPDRTAGPPMIAANILRIRRAQSSDPAEARFVMSPTPNNGLTAPTEMCTEQLAIGDELEGSDLVVLRVFSSRAGYVYVIDQELSPEPGRPVAVVMGDAVKAGATIDLPPSPSGGVSYFRLESDKSAYLGEQLTVLVTPDELKPKTETSGGVRILDPRTWTAWEREYSVLDGVPGARFERGWLKAAEGSKELKVETASGTYKAPPGSSAAVARITLRIRPTPR